MDFPRMLYRPGKAIRWNGHDLDHRTVADEAEHAAALRDGWVEPEDLGKPAKADPFDHDHNGEPGGSLPKTGAKPRKAKAK